MPWIIGPKIRYAIIKNGLFFDATQVADRKGLKALLNFYTASQNGVNGDKRSLLLRWSGKQKLPQITMMLDHLPKKLTRAHPFRMRSSCRGERSTLPQSLTVSHSMKRTYYFLIKDNPFVFICRYDISGVSYSLPQCLQSQQINASFAGNVMSVISTCKLLLQIKWNQFDHQYTNGVKTP